MSVLPGAVTACPEKSITVVVPFPPGGATGAFAAPEGWPKDVQATLHGEIVTGLNDPGIMANPVAQGFEVVANTPEQFGKFQLAEQARWKHVSETGKITAD